MDLRWLDWSRRLAAIAQNGLAFSPGPYDKERYEAVRHIAAEIMAVGTGAEISVVEGLFSKESGYATPKVDVRGVVFQGDSLLFVREKMDGCWTLPGGFADIGDSPAESAEREIFEESGYKAKAVKVLAVYDRNKHPHKPPHTHHIYKIFFLCELLGGEPKASSETTDVAFFTEDKIPELSLGRVTPDQVVRMFEHHQNPDWPADFD